MSREILVTSALPYANGPIHIGHLVEYIQTDIWVRFQRMRGNDCRYVCADDAHGTPIMLRAEREGITPEALIQRYSDEHQSDFRDFGIDFDNYYSTHSDENRELAAEIYNRLDDAGLIARRVISQAYDPEREMFLPDRFIRGDCPKCDASDQYGDSCENCGATYAPTDLKNAVSVVSGATPVVRDSEHYFFRLAEFNAWLGEFLATSQIQSAVRAKLDEWFEAGLQDWDISRDAPYFGFEIPGAPGKYFYVWLDAPIGYMASFQNLCAGEADLDFNHYWKADSTTELYHFIGKDIVYFHTLFWPAMLRGAGFRPPTGVFAHGFLTVDGAKMSKSRGTFIRARTWLDHLPAEYLRYYFAAKLSDGVEDIDLNLDDFVARINSDLVGKYVNIASRCAGFISKRFDGRLADRLDQPELFQEFAAAADAIAKQYEARRYSQAVRDTMLLADRANQYIAERAPWKIAKQDGGDDELQAVCTTAINLFAQLTVMLKPVLPATANAAEQFLNVESMSWPTDPSPLLSHAISRYQPLANRVDAKAVQALLDASGDDMTANSTTPHSTGPSAMSDNANERPAADNQTASTGTDDSNLIDFDDFAKLDLRVARVTKAELIDGADRLLRLQLDLGDGDSRQVLAGIRSAYAPEDLEGRHVVVVANLKPRKMRFGVSEGMILAASGDAGLFVIQPDDGATPGMSVG